ncbi:MAG: SDR family NAD(P)-dependent oxidoreductase [Elusimicrobiota bacterium]
MPDKLENSVVVVTGASSGAGRAAALAFARRGAFVALADRREQALCEAAQQCERLGGRKALVIPSRAADESSLKDLLRRTVRKFGRVNAWINKAAVTLLPRFDDGPAEEYRRIIETNLLTYLYGARVVLAHFREKGRGVLINNAAIASKLGQPYTSAYAASNFGIQGLSECLRQEARGLNIHICTVMPSPRLLLRAGFAPSDGKNRAAGPWRRTLRGPETPDFEAEQVAAAIVACAENPRNEYLVEDAPPPAPPPPAEANPAPLRAKPPVLERNGFAHSAGRAFSSGRRTPPPPSLWPAALAAGLYWLWKQRR